MIKIVTEWIFSVYILLV